MGGSNYARVVIAGLSGDSGKTLVSCGLLGCFRERGLDVSAFKKGPDYIDPAWLGLASGKPARNLDTFLMGFDAAKESFMRRASREGINVVEGNRGLFDGLDSVGTHSTAELAKLLEAPVILILNISKVTRTAAAIVLGCNGLDPSMKIAGVILNNAANARHASVAKHAIESVSGVHVFGAIPKLPESSTLPSRHLGLIMPGEYRMALSFLKEAKQIMGDNVDIAGLGHIAFNAVPLEYCGAPEAEVTACGHVSEGMRIAYFKDESFSFYYPENLEALELAGATLVPISPSRGVLSDDIDALYIGGGLPEMNLNDLVLNREMLERVKLRAERGLPIYAECAGLMYLASCLEWNGNAYRMSGVLPITVRVSRKPQGHGYCEASVDGKNAFFRQGSVLKGHEFHYSRIVDHDAGLRTSLRLTRGVGSFDKRDGLTYKNVFASYMHLHATSCPEWASGMIECARKYTDFRKGINRKDREDSRKGLEERPVPQLSRV